MSNEDNLDLKETDEATHKFNESVQPEEGRLRPHSRVFFGSKGFRRQIITLQYLQFKEMFKSEEITAILITQSRLG